MSAQEAARIVADLLARGFSATDVARGLGLGAKGSGSYVGQIAAGKKGATKVGELRQLLAAAKRAREIPGGRSKAATEARRQILGGAAVKRTPRQRKAGGDAAVRRAARKITDKGYVQATAATQALASGGAPIEDAIRSLAPIQGRIGLRVVARFKKERVPAATQRAPKSDEWRRYYGKGKHAANRKRGSDNILEVSFGASGAGMAATDWVPLMDAAGNFTEALLTWMTAQGYERPAQLLRVELNGWVPGSKKSKPKGGRRQ